MMVLVLVMLLMMLQMISTDSARPLLASLGKGSSGSLRLRLLAVCGIRLWYPLSFSCNPLLLAIPLPLPLVVLVNQ